MLERIEPITREHLIEHGQTVAKNATLLAQLVPGDVFTAVTPKRSVNSNGMLFIEREMSYNWYSYESATLFVLARVKTADFIRNNPSFEATVRSLYSVVPGPHELAAESELYAFYCVACKKHQNTARTRFALEPGQIVMSTPEIIAVEHELVVIHR